jgi:hypothetical protein
MIENDNPLSLPFNVDFLDQYEKENSNPLWYNDKKAAQSHIDLEAATCLFMDHYLKVSSLILRLLPVSW